MPSVPVTDDKNNPFYCPTVPASVYLRSLRRKVQQLSKLPRHHQSPSLSFDHQLERSSHGDRSGTVEAELGSDWILGDYLSSSRGWFSSQGSGHPQRDDRASLPPPYSYSPQDSTQVHHPRVTYRQGHHRSSFVANPSGFSASSLSGLKRKNLFSDLAAPPKYARSIPSFHDSSFDLELKREVLRFSEAPSSDSYYGKASPPMLVALGSPDALSLVEQVALALPGVRLQERLTDIQSTSAQDVMTFLAENGYISERILDIFSTTDVKTIILAPSLFDENGLNICSQGLYSIFGRPNCFQSLRELSFTGISIRDADIRHIHHLPCLSVLLLGDTSITNEAVFLLMPLKQTLTRLCLASNPDINNDSVPAIILLYKLEFLSLFGTSVDMAGLRRLAEAMKKDSRNTDIEIPISCETYVANLNTRYLCVPLPPLITDPAACPLLSAVALKRNLEAHAVCNPDIVASGTRQEMALRLADILRTRRLDALVVGMLDDSDDT